MVSFCMFLPSSNPAVSRRESLHPALAFPPLAFSLSSSNPSQLFCRIHSRSPVRIFCEDSRRILPVLVCTRDRGRFFR
ncbi:hypothetical protein HPP92_002125 [Vanilla planifolia]|uniref:Uncharacterized protein n=1 Tax=Vanilla planifolia TaxID=51239 RepID=A0A835SE29_VANPL|nr:hypothetical protein HPP92_002125 [Vanilla planifolia]